MLGENNHRFLSINAVKGTWGGLIKGKDHKTNLFSFISSN